MKLCLKKNQVIGITGNRCHVFSKLRKAFCSFKGKKEENAGSVASADSHREKARELEKGAGSCTDHRWALAAAARCDEAVECGRRAVELRKLGNEEAALEMEEREACANARAAAMIMNIGKYDEARGFFQKAEAQLGSVVKGYKNAGKPLKAEWAGIMREHVQDINQDYNSISILLVNLPVTFPF